MSRCILLASVVSIAFCIAHAQDQPQAEKLEETQLLKLEGDIASLLVNQADDFLLKELKDSVGRRAQHWNRDFSSPEKYTESIEPNRKRLAHILGVRDKRAEDVVIHYNATTADSSVAADTENFVVHSVSWPAFGDVTGTGLMLVPKDDSIVADVIAIPDANQSPEQIAGLLPGLASEEQFARRLAESGCRVMVPLLINREDRRDKLTNREYLYRSAFELGRHLIGYEIQKVLALSDWFEALPGGTKRKTGVVGWGEGGLIALYAAALDQNIDVACVSGYFDSRQRIWEEPLDRNVFGLLEQFGDAEIASLIAPRSLIVEAARAPVAVIPGGRGAPAKVETPPVVSVEDELERAKKLINGLGESNAPQLKISGATGDGPPLNSATLQTFLTKLKDGARLSEVSSIPEDSFLLGTFDPEKRHAQQLHEIDRHNQWLLRESPYVRKEFMKGLDTSSIEKYAETVESYRDTFRHEVIGHFQNPLLPPNPHSRKSYESDKWIGYEVVLDVFEPGVIAYGILLLPKDIKKGEKRPVVVCQHGLEGRPQDVIQGDKGAYHDFAAKLADRGFVTFSPQNLYIFQDRFRTLQRKANPIKKTLFSIIVPQHQQIVNWLKTQPWVDSERIAFYGLSYGGKTAMRVPPLVSEYCLSICAADFNEWVWKNASTRSGYSYVNTGEYEIFEWDLGSTFNYAEMAALIAPRPFMVERGHFDGVAPDETVGYEFAKVRNLYQARLKLKGRCEIEWFDGPHTINGKGTYDFLHKHLDWPVEESNR
jgi:dienelactone hydrolase